MGYNECECSEYTSSLTSTNNSTGKENLPTDLLQIVTMKMSSISYSEKIPVTKQTGARKDNDLSN